MTHAHPDHSGGLASVLVRHRPREFWWTGVAGRGRAWEGLRAALAASGVRDRVLAAGSPLPPPFAGTAAVLHPPRDEAPRSLNDSSLALRLGGPLGVLLTGDVEAAAEAALLGDPRALASAVLKVPHHGSRTSSTPAFVAAVAPRVAVISVGADNRYRLPAPEVEARYRAHGACVLRTDRCGAVTVELDGRRLRVRTWRPGCECPVDAAVAAVVRPPG
jgi:competence protein ComEC